MDLNDIGNIVPLYSMMTAKNITGLTDRQIRHYEEKELIFPFRTAGRQRVFSKVEIKIMEEIKDLLKEGYRLKIIKEKIEIKYAKYYESQKRTPDVIKDVESRMFDLERNDEIKRGHKNFYDLDKNLK